MARKHRWVIVTLLLGVFMGALDIFIVAPALGAIQTGLGVPARLITWSFTAYTLVMVVTQPFIAKLSDLYGRRWVYAGCAALFGAGSALCATSHAFAPFIAGRCVQAIGAGGILPVANAVIADLYPEEKRGRMLALNGIMFCLAFLLGPIIGGALTQGIHFGGLVTDWHSIFVVNLPISVLIIALASRLLPAKPAVEMPDFAFDWTGMLLLASALFLLVFGLTQLDFTNLSANFTNETAMPFVVLGLAFFVPFALHEQHAANPIVDVVAFSRRQLVLTMALSLIGGAVTSSVVYVPQLVESARHLGSGAGGFYLFYVAITLLFGAESLRRLLDRYGPRAVMLGGGIVSACGFALLLAAGRNNALIIIALLLAGAGMATLVGTPLRYIVTNEAPARHRATSLSVLTICSSIGQTIILPLGGALISSSAVASPAATLRAIHSYYAVILAVMIVGLALALQLKTHQQELAERRGRRVAQARRKGHVIANAPALRREQHDAPQPAMSSR